MLLIGDLAAMLSDELIPFVIGEQYHRRSDIHGKYKGQQYGGCSTPKNTPFIFLFTGAAGKHHGYNDDWNNGVFNFYGEGQRGDMVFIKSNRAIRDHVANQKRLLLFSAIKQKTKGWVKYEGEFICASYDYRQTPDTDGHEREAIVFHLIPALSSIQQPHQRSIITPSEQQPDLNLLRSQAYEAASKGPTVSKTLNAAKKYRSRSKKVHSYVLARANGVCEGCNIPAPFLKIDGSPYLEPHHIIRLADEGPDHPSTVISLCPTCHKRVHFGKDGSEYNDRLSAIVSRLETNHEQ